MLKFLLPVILITIATLSFAQNIDLDESPAGCVVWEVKGKVTYLEKGNVQAKPVVPGTAFPEDATVVVGKKSSLTIACDDRLLPVGTKGTYLMAALMKEVQTKGEPSRFAKMASVAKGYVGTDTTKVKKGWGAEDSILFNIPTRGKIPLQPVIFKWTSLKEGSTYQLIIFQNAKDSPILSATTSVASFSFDPAQLAVKTGQPCYAQVMLANDNSTTSIVVSFTFIALHESEAALAELMKDKKYLKAGILQKTLMEAVELEAKELNSLAIERYRKAIKLNAKSTLASQMYAAFLDRIN